MLIDTSGSMQYGENKKLWARALGIGIKIMNSYHIPIQIYQADAGEPMVMSAQEAERAIKSGKLDLFGGGGSNFKPAFRSIEKTILQDHPMGAPIFVFTDGEIAVPENPKPVIKHSTLWVTPLEKEAPAEWARSVYLQ